MNKKLDFADYSQIINILMTQLNDNSPDNEKIVDLVDKCRGEQIDLIHKVRG